MHVGAGRRQPAPFIVGASRSGTTLLRLMLDAHPEVAIPPETEFIPAAVAATEGSPDPATAFCDAVITSSRWVDFQLSADDYARAIQALDPFDAGTAIRMFYQLYSERFSKPRWGDKTPLYLHHMASIERVLPEARFIHLVRDGRDVACSILPLGWSWGPQSIPEAAAWWVERIRSARAQAAHLTGYLEVRFEDLVTRTEETLRTIADFVSLPFSPAMLTYAESASVRMAEMTNDITHASGRVILRGKDRPALHRFASGPPEHSRVERWRHDMDPADRHAFEAIAGPLLEEFGYSLEG